MTGNRTFWIAIMAAILGLYLAALLLALQGNLANPAVRLSLIFLAAHVLELPLAFRALRGRNAQAGRVVAATLVFGAAWWLPARRGLFAVA